MSFKLPGALLAVVSSTALVVAASTSFFGPLTTKGSIIFAAALLGTAACCVVRASSTTEDRISTAGISALIFGGVFVVLVFFEYTIEDLEIFQLRIYFEVAAAISATIFVLFTGPEVSGRKPAQDC